jgi:hypothetical protein
MYLFVFAYMPFPLKRFSMYHVCIGMYMTVSACFCIYICVFIIYKRQTGSYSQVLPFSPFDSRWLQCWSHLQDASAHQWGSSHGDWWSASAPWLRLCMITGHHLMMWPVDYTYWEMSNKQSFQHCQQMSLCSCRRILVLSSAVQFQGELCCCIHCNTFIYCPNTCIYMNIHTNTYHAYSFPITQATCCTQIHHILSDTCIYIQIHAYMNWFISKYFYQFWRILCTYLHVFWSIFTHIVCIYMYFRKAKVLVALIHANMYI